jgi:hypothetical protein
LKSDLDQEDAGARSTPADTWVPVDGVECELVTIHVKPYGYLIIKHKPSGSQIGRTTCGRWSRPTAVEYRADSGCLRTHHRYKGYELGTTDLGMRWVKKDSDCAIRPASTFSACIPKVSGLYRCRSKRCTLQQKTHATLWTAAAVSKNTMEREV